MKDGYRRELLKKGGALLSVGMLGGAGLRAVAAREDTQVKDRDCTSSITISADSERVCGTCRHWGGMRKTSTDMISVKCETIGWCNRVDSFNYHMVTAPENGPLECWQRWESLQS